MSHQTKIEAPKIRPVRTVACLPDPVSVSEEYEQLIADGFQVKHVFGVNTGVMLIGVRGLDPIMMVDDSSINVVGNTIVRRKK